MDQLIYASLSHTHFWYEVGMLEVPAVERRGHYRPPQEGRQTEYGNYRSISLVSHAGKVLLKVVARRVNHYCKVKGLLPEEQCGLRPDRSTTEMMFLVRRLQEIGRKAGESLSMYVCMIIHIARVWINRVKLPILLVVS